MTHVMLDLETWGTTPGCDIRSIGAVVFNPTTGHVAEGNGRFYIATDNPSLPLNQAVMTVPAIEPCIVNGLQWNWDGIDAFRKYRLTRDPSTVEWWNKQSFEAKSAFTNPTDLRDALQAFKLWLGAISIDNNDGHGEQLRLWAHGPSFDVSILDAAYRAVGLPIPWHYRAPRDTRTIMEAAGMDPHKGLEPFNTGTHHNALDDAVTQAKAVCHAYARLRDDTYEECAKICEGVTSWGLSPTKLEVAESTQNFCAKAIRAQKSDSEERRKHVDKMQADQS